MSVIRIYQIISELDLNRQKFMSLKLENESVDSSIYAKVFEGNVGTDNLDQIYLIFNVNHPKDFLGHSLSISDVIEIEGSPKSSFYFCNTFGFLEINFDTTKVSNAQLIKTVIVEADKPPYEKYLLNDERAFLIELGNKVEKMQSHDNLCCYYNKDKNLFVASGEEGSYVSLNSLQAKQIKEQFHSRLNEEIKSQAASHTLQMY
ncbi:YodL domain-containing protein [Paludicola sp. MB14-C6]|uniref:YodL domain-containing protein n=1 Tax=Paludihabitans sp. MB14-C6 TaxID=3070656 RepID=UPI0027DE52A2|nr:YodL domain-containing protein [Paludicola sp. MB14-C6]WMJ22701.1 YodL domain-containing protein [Paludicola sp. MB14-C6]